MGNSSTSAAANAVLEDAAAPRFERSSSRSVPLPRDVASVDAGRGSSRVSASGHAAKRPSMMSDSRHRATSAPNSPRNSKRRAVMAKKGGNRPQKKTSSRRRSPLADQSWLVQVPFESTYLDALRRREARSVTNRQVASLDECARGRFMSMRKYVLEQQRSINRKIDYPVHPRTYDLAMVFAETFLLEHIMGENMVPRKLSGTGGFSLADLRTGGTCPARLCAAPGGGPASHRDHVTFGGTDSSCRTLAMFHPERHELNLLASSAFWVAAKVEEIHPPSVELFLRAARTTSEFYAFEKKLCLVNNFAFNPVTRSDWFNFFMASEGAGILSVERHISNHVQRTLLRFKFNKCLGAIACIILGGVYSTQEKKIIDANVIDVSGVTRKDLVMALDAIHDMLYNKASRADTKAGRSAYKIDVKCYPDFRRWVLSWEPSEMAQGKNVCDASTRAAVWMKRSRALRSAYFME